MKTQTEVTKMECAEEVDEYTAKMDRMVSGLKNRSKVKRAEQTRLTIIWLGVGVLVTAAMIFLALNVTSNGFEDMAHLLSR
ncbi:MAG: hypothetical protein GC154_18370 [bacterium]|nr:hypothetical protein [bacterium]